MDNKSIDINQRIPLDTLYAALESFLNGSYSNEYILEQLRLEFNGENRLKKALRIVNKIIQKNPLNDFLLLNAGEIKNHHWLVCDNDTNEEYIVIECHDNNYTKVSTSFLPKLFNIDGKKLTWYKLKNGYYGTHVNKTVRYLHAHVMDHYGNGTKKGAKSVDHINQQMDDNRNENLRLLSQSEQNKNTGKRARKKNAQPLPEELNGIELPKFVNYNCEKRTTKHGVSYRDFFRIEKHPKLKKVWSSSKSIKIDIIEKLEQTKKRLAELENE